ncbi:CAP domain-containing protein [uncultured Methylobacterium sp.]|uniref:CAP domain-containing protein n=1 Tax=uncultured Methylobacterium sp. TaxID=157278 RepID=UPI0035CC98BF
MQTPAARHRRALALVGVLALALSACGTPTILGESAGPVAPVILDETAAAAAISRYRAQHGLGPVVVDAGLVTAAARQAGTNARAGVLSHDVGGGFAARMASAGLARAWSAENLSAGSETFDQVLARWKASPEHDRNMLIPQIRRIGIARVDAPGTRYKRFWALVMAGG